MFCLTGNLSAFCRYTGPSITAPALSPATIAGTTSTLMQLFLLALSSSPCATAGGSGR